MQTRIRIPFPEETPLVLEEQIGEERISQEAGDAREPRRGEPAAPGEDARMRLYLLKVLAVMVLLYLAPFFVARTSLYERLNPSFYARPLEYPFKTAGQNADVVLFGDSTALLGLDPSQMSSALGVKVLNLVNTQPSLMVNDDLSLRFYLSHNRAPRLIVFYFAPWDFDYGHISLDLRPVYEGEELLLRHGSRQDIATFARKHPMDALAFPLRFYASAWKLIAHRVPHANQDAQLAATLGHVDTTDSTVLAAPCEFPSYLLDNVRFSWVQALAERFQSPQTKVMFFVAPVPTCSNVSSLLARPFHELPAKPPRSVPPEFFTNDVRFIHPRRFAVPLVTEDLIEAVRPQLGNESQRPTR